MKSRKSGRTFGWKALLSCYAPQRYYDDYRELTEVESYIEGLSRRYNNLIFDRDAPVDTEKARNMAGEIMTQQKKYWELLKTMTARGAKPGYVHTSNCEDTVYLENFLKRTFAYLEDEPSRENALTEATTEKADDPRDSKPSKKRMRFSTEPNPEVKFHFYESPSCLRDTIEDGLTNKIDDDLAIAVADELWPLRRSRRYSESHSSSATALLASSGSERTNSTATLNRKREPDHDQDDLPYSSPGRTNSNPTLKRKRGLADDQYDLASSGSKRTKIYHAVPWPEAYRAEAVGILPHRASTAKAGGLYDFEKCELKAAPMFTAHGLRSMFPPSYFDNAICGAGPKCRRHLTLSTITPDDIVALLEEYPDGISMRAFFARFPNISRKHCKQLVRIAKPVMRSSQQADGESLLFLRHGNHV